MQTPIFSTRDASNGILALCQAAEERRRYRERIPLLPQDDSDEETDSTSHSALFIL